MFLTTLVDPWCEFIKLVDEDDDVIEFGAGAFFLEKALKFLEDLIEDKSLTALVKLLEVDDEDGTVTEGFEGDIDRLGTIDSDKAIVEALETGEVLDALVEDMFRMAVPVGMARVVSGASFLSEPAHQAVVVGDVLFFKDGLDVDPDGLDGVVPGGAVEELFDIVLNFGDIPDEGFDFTVFTDALDPGSALAVEGSVDADVVEGFRVDADKVVHLAGHDSKGSVLPEEGVGLVEVKEVLTFNVEDDAGDLTSALLHAVFEDGFEDEFYYGGFGSETGDTGNVKVGALRTEEETFVDKEGSHLAVAIFEDADGDTLIIALVLVHTESVFDAVGTGEIDVGTFDRPDAVGGIDDDLDLTEDDLVNFGRWLNFGRAEIVTDIVGMEVFHVHDGVHGDNGPEGDVTIGRDGGHKVTEFNGDGFLTEPEIEFTGSARVRRSRNRASENTIKKVQVFPIFLVNHG